MYTLEQLQQKNLLELKEIGHQLNVLPDGDRRLKRNWIDALVGTQPTLLQLLEVSPGAEVEPVQEAIEPQAQEPLLESSPEALECPSCGAVHALYSTKDYLDRPEIRCLHCNYSRFKNYPGAIRLEAQESIEITSEDKELRSEDKEQLASKFGRIVYPRSAVAKIEPKVSQSAIVQVLENSPGVSRKSTAHQLLDLFKSSAHIIIEDSPVKTTEAVIQSAIVPAQNPILTGIALSDSFLARYSPPQPENIHYHSDADGQLSLLDFEVESTDEPPDPDDYPSLEDFQQVYDAWNARHGDSSNFGESNAIRRIGQQGASDVFESNQLPADRDGRAELHGTCCHHQDEGLGGQKGDRLLVESGDDSGSSGGVLPHQPLELAPIPAPIAAYNEERRPPNRGDGRGTELAIGMLVGRRRDRLHVGKIAAIYQSKRGIWRAKVRPLNKSNFVYFDCANLIEQKLLYDYEMSTGGFIRTGTIFDKARGESFEVYSRKVRSHPSTNWTAAQLSSLSAFKLKQIARDMEIFSIPGRTGKQSSIRAILAEQVLRERPEPAAVKPADKPAVKSRKKSGEIGLQLSLDLVVA
ncbi:hypothetical protein [Microcoleus sp. F4-D5]|uniref:hypothetical protein n=1 Tax=Microcoleus sp. F4-D5 TaxID=2818760 RepID=UPI002FD51A01